MNFLGSVASSFSSLLLAGSVETEEKREGERGSSKKQKYNQS